VQTKSLAIATVLFITLSAVVIGCMSISGDNSAQHRRIVDAYVAAYNEHSSDEVARLYDANAMLLYSDSPTPRFGRTEVINGLESFFVAFPDVRMDYTFFMSDSTFFAIEGTWRGTHTGPLQSSAGEVPPTGRQIEMRFAMIAEISPEGLIVSDRGYYNVQDFIRQIFPQGVPLMAPDTGAGSGRK
jgi:predicted ester cyclase